MPRAQQQRPFLVRVCVSKELQIACFDKTGVAPDDSFVCCNVRCGGLMGALAALAPLQEVVK